MLELGLVVIGLLVVAVIRQRAQLKRDDVIISDLYDTIFNLTQELKKCNDSLHFLNELKQYNDENNVIVLNNEEFVIVRPRENQSEKV